MRKILLTIPLCLALAIAGCGGGSSSGGTTESTAQTTSESTSESGAEAGAGTTETSGTKPKVKVPSGPPPKHLVSKDLIEGSGAEAKPGDKVTVQYVLVDYNTGKEIEASWDRGEPFPFTLGAGEVIPGWEQGVEGMKVGGRRELIIPPSLAYGSKQAGAIAPNSTLIFVIDLVAVE